MHFTKEAGRGNRAKLVELAKLLAGGGKAKNRRVVSCRQKEEGGGREEKGREGNRHCLVSLDGASHYKQPAKQSKAVKR